MKSGVKRPLPIPSLIIFPLFSTLMVLWTLLLRVRVLRGVMAGLEMRVSAKELTGFWSPALLFPSWVSIEHGHTAQIFLITFPLSWNGINLVPPSTTHLSSTAHDLMTLLLPPGSLLLGPALAKKIQSQTSILS